MNVKIEVCNYGEAELDEISFVEIKRRWCDPMFRFLKVTWGEGNKQQTREFGKEEIVDTVIDYIDQIIVNEYHDEQRKKARTYNNYAETAEDTGEPLEAIKDFAIEVHNPETDTIEWVGGTEALEIKPSGIQENYTATGSASHYQDIIPGYEYMDIMEHILGYDGVVAHLKGQIYKYMMRMGRKDSAIQEATKVSWYSERLRTTIALKDANLFPRKPMTPAIESMLKGLS
jgi:hypothetical protein